MGKLLVRVNYFAVMVTGMKFLKLFFYEYLREAFTKERKKNKKILEILFLLYITFLCPKLPKINKSQLSNKKSGWCLMQL